MPPSQNGTSIAPAIKAGPEAKKPNGKPYPEIQWVESTEIEESLNFVLAKMIFPRVSWSVRNLQTLQKRKMTGHKKSVRIYLWMSHFLFLCFFLFFVFFFFFLGGGGGGAGDLVFVVFRVGKHNAVNSSLLAGLGSPFPHQ